MLKLLNIKIISLLVATNLITGTMIIKTQSCSNDMELRKAALMEETRRLRATTPPGARTPTNIPYANGITK